jgi:hypothetical protein
MQSQHEKGPQATSAGLSTQGMPALQPMELIDFFHEETLLGEDVVAFVLQVNAAIEQFNTSTDAAQKAQCLESMKAHIKHIDHKYPDSYLAGAIQYRQIRNYLCEDIQEQARMLGIDSTHRDNTSLSAIINNLPQTEADKLLKLLEAGPKTNFQAVKELYNAADPREQALSYRQFWLTHEISYLGGGNSKNFKVTSADGSSMVLKVDGRRDRPRDIEDRAREQFKGLVSAIHAEKLASFIGRENKRFVATVLVTDYYEAGSLYQHLKVITDPALKGKRICQHFEYMAAALLDIQKAGFAFPDCKLENWIVDREGRLYITDTKSFLRTNKSGVYTPDKVPENTYYQVLYTHNLKPPELDTGIADADTTHAYILGKSLYDAVVGYSPAGDQGYEFDFSSTNFKTSLGRKIVELIRDLVHPDPKNRLSMQAAYALLYMMNNPDVEALLLPIQNKNNQWNRQQDLHYDFAFQKVVQIQANPAMKEGILSELRQAYQVFMDADQTMLRLWQSRLDADDTVLTSYIAEIGLHIGKLSIEERLVFLKHLEAQSNDFLDILRRYQAVFAELRSLATLGDVEMDTLQKQMIQQPLEHREEALKQLEALAKKYRAEMKPKATVTTDEGAEKTLEIKAALSAMRFFGKQDSPVDSSQKATTTKPSKTE